MILEINENNINDKYIDRVVEVLKKGGIIIFPTDTVYAMGCDAYNKKALEKMAKIKNVKLNKANFSIICSSMSDLSKYVKQIDKSVFKLLNSSLPGPFTFILEATNEVSKIFDLSRKEIGIRIPNNQITIQIVEKLGNPIATTSLKDDNDKIIEYFNDPDEIYEQFESTVDAIIDGGYGKLEGSTVINLTSGQPIIIRQGLGIL